MALSLQFFGAFEARLDGKRLPTLRTRKGQWLLALLILRPDRDVDRAWLAGLLWPESRESQALFNLRQSLSDVRRALGTQAFRLYSPSRHTLSLNTSGLDCDILTFDAALLAGDQASLERAVTLYLGPLLEGCDEEWLLPEREKREQAYLEALERLARNVLDANAPDKAVHYLRRLVATDSLRESAYRALMQALAALGDYPAVTQVYRDFRLHLHSELNAEPDEETVNCFRQLNENRQITATRNRSAEKPLSGVAISVPESFEESSPARFCANNLPTETTSFIGREKEIEAIQGLLETTRLLTLTGSGGCGKTRLALQVASRYIESVEGVWFVEFASLTASALVPQAVADVLDIKETEGEPLLETLQKFLHLKRLLIVLDNCEHLRDACARLAETLLSSCPNLTLLAASRERLNSSGEQTYRVPSLSLPPSSEAMTVMALSQYEAARLFMERATSAVVGFTVRDLQTTALAQLCVRLDGIPLAIELAAARVRSLTIEEINARLDASLRLLTKGQPGALPRQQTLRATLNWSVDLLSADERTILARLSVFAGGWTLEAAEQICAEEEDRQGEGKREEGSGQWSVVSNTQHPIEDWEIMDMLTSLVSKSLVIAERREEQTRYRFLETMRQYGREQLEERGETATVRRRHRDYFLTLGETAKSEMTGPKQAEWTGNLETEHENLRAALEYCRIEARHSDPVLRATASEAGLRLAAALTRFWATRGYLAEGLKHLTSALADSPLADVEGEKPAASRASALGCAGMLAVWQGDYAAGSAFYEEGLALWRRLGDRLGIAQAVNALGVIAMDQGDYDTACPLYEKALSLSYELENQEGVANCLYNLARMRFAQGDYESACANFSRTLALQRKRGDKHGIANALNALGVVAQTQQDYETARPLYTEALTLNRDLGHREGEATALSNLGSVVQALGDREQAQGYFEQSLSIRQEIGDRHGMSHALGNLGILAMERGEYAAAGEFYRECLLLQQELGDKDGIASSLGNIGNLQAAQGRPDCAARLHGAAQTLRECIGAGSSTREREEYTHTFESLRAALGEESCQQALETGRALTLEQAVEYALTNSVI